MLAADGIRKHGAGFGSSTSRSADDGAKALRSVETYDLITDTCTAAAPMVTAPAHDFSFSLVPPPLTPTGGLPPWPRRRSRGTSAVMQTQ